MGFSDFLKTHLPPAKQKPRTLAQLHGKRKQLSFAFPLPQPPKRQGSRGFSAFLKSAPVQQKPAKPVQQKPAPAAKPQAPRVSGFSAFLSSAPPAPASAASRTGSLEGVTVVFTGFRDAGLEARVRDAGGYPATSFVKGVGLVVAKDPSTASQKAEKARAMGVPVVGVPALQRMLAGGAMPRVQAQAPRQAPRVQAPRAPSGDPLKGGVLLAEKWTPEMDPTGYWMSEKLDGVRAIWDGEAFYSRNGNRFATPASFARLLPKTTLDGELYIGPGQFNDTVSIVRSGVANPQRWKAIRYMVFDLPDSREPFEERVRHIRSIVADACRKSDGPCPIEAVEQVRCTSPAHFGKFHAEAVAQGSEGTMLRAPGSVYERRRSRTLLKAKDFHDAEARIVGTYAGEGKHRGRLGGYEAVDEETGVRFRVGSGLTDQERERPLPVGTRITYRYQERTPSGAPRFPTFVAVRDYE